MITTKDLEEIRARVNAGQQWKPEDCEIQKLLDSDGEYIYVPECATIGDTRIQLTDAYEGHQDDWNFIAHSREDVNALLKLVDRFILGWGSLIVFPTEKDVHTEHCCKEHGCKYGLDDCTVVSGEKLQHYACFECEELN